MELELEPDKASSSQKPARTSGDGHPQPARCHAVEYVHTVADGLIAEADEESRRLRQDIERLSLRLDLARRRLQGASGTVDASAAMPGLPSVRQWLGTGQEVSEMRKRMEEAVNNEEALMKLVAEVRHERESCTENALQFYAIRTQQLLNASPR